jgi:hypothetical protein
MLSAIALILPQVGWGARSCTRARRHGNRDGIRNAFAWAQRLSLTEDHWSSPTQLPAQCSALVHGHVQLLSHLSASRRYDLPRTLTRREPSRIGRCRALENEMHNAARKSGIWTIDIPDGRGHILRAPVPGHLSGANATRPDRTGSRPGTSVFRLYEQWRGVGRVAGELGTVEGDAKARQRRDLEIALGIEREGPLGDAIDIGAAADELDQIHVGEG